MNADEQNAYQNDILKLIELSGVHVFNDYNAFMRCKDKVVANMILRQNDIPVPNSMLINNHTIKDVVNDFFKESGSVLIKPRTNHGGKGIMKIDTLEQFWDIYTATSNVFDNYYIEHRNNFNDYYTLGKDYNPFDEYQNQFRVPYLNRQNNFKKEYNNYYRDSNLPINDLRYNYSKDNYKEIHSVSKSMNSFDLEEYKRRINEREKQLISNYETYNKIKNVPNISQIKNNDNSNINFTEINHSTKNPNISNIQFTEIKSSNNNIRNNSNKVTQSNSNRTVVSNPNNLTISTYNSRKTPKYKITNYYTDYNNHQELPKDINEHVKMPSKIYFI